MSIVIEKLKNSLVRLNSALNSNEIQRYLSKKKIIAEDVDEIIQIICDTLLQNPHHASLIRDNFGFILFPIVCKFLNLPENRFFDFQNKCVALSILAKNNLQVIKYSFQFFSENQNAPFHQQSSSSNSNSDGQQRNKKLKVTQEISDLDIVQTCLRFLKLDTSFYRQIWNWSEFFDRYQNQGCDLQKLHYNQIVSMVLGMTNYEYTLLNQSVPTEIFIKSEIENDKVSENLHNDTEEGESIEWKFESDIITYVEGIYLPIFNKSVVEYYNNKLDIVRVDTTKINLRSLALGVSSGRAVCLSGSVGSGKTTLVEYLAKKVGRLPPKLEDYQKFIESKKESELRSLNGNKRKMQTTNDNNTDQQNVLPNSGFLRIQLGDQTDSKVLLGQFRCTDVPGEFLWQPGVLTQAVMNGYWLLLEDIDTATQDVCTILSNLLENNFLRVPGFRENLKIANGFQLFLTLRTHKSGNQSSNSTYSLLEKHLYTINILPLSRTELSTVICQNYPKLATVAKRIVDVFLIFSRGCHTNETDYDDIETKTKIKPKEKAIDEEILPYANKFSNLLHSNSGRMISTRDLLKLCERSNQTFQATSSECAYFVFQNCVDLFCSHLPAGELRTNLIISIGARLGIIETRCIHLSNEFKPTVQMTTDEISIGRATLNRSNKESDGKRIKLCEDSDILEKVSKEKQLPPTFSFTRVSACVLERIAVAVHQNEPILLCGETGTGKTSSVQYLAYQTNHKLVVVNMNNQSDVSDLIGGYRPVDISFIVTPLRNEFEKLFARKFDIIKNEKFLGHVSRCFNSNEFSKLISLMSGFISKYYKLCTENNNDDANRWQHLERKLKKLDQQLKKSVNLSFAFIPGSLVNCIRNGDWVLLDEINLATTETLECLSTILEPNGSIILLERGDFVPIKRHPDFRIFACMNPSTDVGKKDLPVGIRNRFSEFFVDELTVENDLLILVGDYLNNTGIEKSRIHRTVQLYMELRNLAQLELNDGLGNKPVFSLRTLCRALKTCAKNLCGSVERNIYESFCLSFLTQLDPQSHATVLQRIQKYLVSDVKKVISQSIPRPNGNVMNFEGYWIESGEKESQECKEYILTESVKKNLKDLARIISIGKLPILLQGPTSAGKTSLIEYIAKRSGNICLRINNHEHTDLQEYIGTYVADVSGKLAFQEGVLVKAMRNGYWIILDELNLASSDILEALNRVLDDNRELYIPETQTLVKAHPNFMLFATQNPPGIYGGRKTLSRAFKNRFIELHFSEIPKNELEIILEKRCMIPPKYAQKMVKTMTALQVNRRTTTKNNFTLRDLFRWGNRYTYADSKLLDDRNYDWNQHLVDEGYLVLSAKVRNHIETEIIIETLYKNFSKRISTEKLFTLDESTSMVTKDILKSLIEYKGTQSVVWTYEMRRMGVLVSKSLQFNEPILLVGPTGCGKTTICQLLAELHEKNLRILNCHMHTESADFLGGLRPCRESNECEKKSQLFEWSDGPLVYSMIEGNYFLADEISLAEDSVLERLNCVLEPERTLLLSEKGETNENKVENSNFIITAKEGFQFLATMNPGGDFGKKELSPALRNRFTEIWCTAIYTDEDLLKITKNSMELSYGKNHSSIEKIGEVVVRTINVLKQNVEKLNFSIRDVLAWVNYITKNYDLTQNKSNLNLNEALYYGLHTIFLDALEMLPYENFQDILTIRTKIINQMQSYINQNLNINSDFSNISDNIECSDVEIDSEFLKFGINPFYIDVNDSSMTKSKFFSFTAPTTKKNLFRVLSALSLNKAILLEGPPGVGKSSIIENIAKTVGYNLVRINLCEHTDIADLFGTDLPAENSIFENSKDDLQLGSFVWRDGPLLAALKAPNTWILMDELNLAPQSVLEGLNAILDHRGEVYIPELNKTFKLNRETRIFATQNPLRQGGGRKGLPQSFLNRFTKVYLRKLEKRDLLHVVNHNYGALEDIEALKSYQLIEKMVTFSERIENGIANLEFGYKGGPFEANLRDMLRWCELITNEKTGYNIENVIERNSSFDDFILVVYEKMKLVYCRRMRADSDIQHILRIFSDIFELDAAQLESKSSAVSLYWTDSKLFLNDIQWDRTLSTDFTHLAKNEKSIILSSQLDQVKSLTECIMLDKPVILCGPSDCGKTKIINTFCAIFNKELYLDTIDDSVTGSFQQFDFNRMLEELWQHVEEIVFRRLIEMTLKQRKSEKLMFGRLFEEWRNYDNNYNSKQVATDDKLNEIDHFCNRLNLVEQILTSLQSMSTENESCIMDRMISDIYLWRNHLQKSSSSLNTGGHFEWIDSIIVKSIRFGHFICLEHVNLVSSAILDRLNPILEPNGQLMISEKGVDENNQPETISKHDNCQIFFTMDPKYGEISRAMRNRCIELSISHQNYTEDDLRKLIFIQGVHEMHLIKAIIEIHKSLCSLSDYTNFGISHVIKMAFLLAQNKSVGVDDKKCLKISALEVYVRSSNLDLLGFGLDYYRSKLKENIVDVVRNVQATECIVNYENLILHSNELTSVKMIKLQSESFIALLKSQSKHSDISSLLTDLSTKCIEIKIDDTDSTARYLLTFLYMISTFSDIEMRKIYLQKTIAALPKTTTLSNLNKRLYEIIKYFSKDESKNDLPWNSKMFPRLRPYKENKLSSSKEFIITLSLILEMVTKEVIIKESVDQKNMDSITYSKGVKMKSFANTVDNKMINELYSMLDAFKSFASSSLKTADSEIDEKTFINSLKSFFWFNRMLSASMQKIFHHNNVRTGLLDELYLHFKWFSKHCVSQILVVCNKNSNHRFAKVFNEVQNFILSHHHSLQLYKKIYVSEFTSFLPFYEAKQIEFYESRELMNNAVNIVPKMNELYEFEEYQKRLILMMSLSYQDFRKQLYSNYSNHVGEILGIFKETWNDEMKECSLINSWIHKFQSHNSDESTVMNLSQKTIEFEEFLKADCSRVDFRKDKYSIETLPILELFIIKTLPLAMKSYCDINEEYVLNIQSIDIESLLLIKILNDPRFDLIQKISNDGVFSTEFKKCYVSLMMSLNYKIQKTIQKSIVVKNDLCRAYENEEIYSASCNQIYINGSLLTNNMISTLIGKNGDIRGTGLGEVKQWKAMLNNLKSLLWMNAEVFGKKYDLLTNELERNADDAEELLNELQITKNKCLALENENFSDFNKDFWNVIEKLNEYLEEVKSSKTWLHNYTIESLSGLIKLNLLSYFPLIDPVKKNRLKTNYLKEDITHFDQLILSYKLMSIMLDYDDLGKENCTLIERQIEELRAKLLKHSKKVALRPEICIYSSMVDDVNHFLTSFCNPKTLSHLISSVKSILSNEPAKNQSIANKKNELNEFISKLNLWIINADKFMGHSLQKYNSYYRDFIAPIEYALTTLKNGFIGLRSLLRMADESIEIMTGENSKFTQAVKELINFPSSLSNNQSSKVCLYSLIDCIDDKERVYFELIKSHIQQITNKSTTAKIIDSTLFEQFDNVLNLCNQLWQKQEELKRKRQIEEDSLYVTKTKCLEEDEETIKSREISELFPEMTENDFNEFIQKDSLEQIKVDNKPTKKAIDIITDEDYQLIGEFFISLMNENNVNQKDYIGNFKHKIKVFSSLFNRFKNSFDNTLDDASYKGLSLLIGMCQESYDELQLNDIPTKTYNFYKDSNIKEAIRCIDVIKKLERRVYVELEQFEDHAVLNDLIIIIKRIKGFASNSPLVRFNVGMQILRKKVYEWNCVAHRLNNFKDIESEIAEIIQSWMSMELQCWRESLNQTFIKTQGKAYRYWFFLYNLIHEYLHNELKSDNDSSLVDYSKVEKRFASDEASEEKFESGNMTCAAVMNVLKQFIESSSYAEFSLRIRLLKSFECYLIKLPTKSSRAFQIIALLHNIHEYFSQFSKKIQDQIDFVRKPIEDKLRKFVKINSFNKDLSYFSTESNIKQVHRNLHKYLKEFEIDISKKITDLFKYKDSGNELDSEHTHKYSNEIPLELFLIANNEEHTTVSDCDIEILQKIHKYTLKSRDIVKTSLSNVKYDKLTDSMNEFIKVELDTCNHLRSLKVDENLAKSKQKSQAKSILNQKRKALSDFFKTMTKMGMNYKSGLLSNSLNSEFIDLEIAPFSIEKIEFSNSTVKNAANNLNHNLDLYFNKSIFKMKLLTNFLLQPRSDMDFSFIERIKGFSIDLMILVQDQRKLLSENVNQLIELKKKMNDLSIIKSSKSLLSYDIELKKFKIIRESFVHMVEILEQIKLLMKCAPENNEAQQLRVVNSTNNTLAKNTPIYNLITKKVDDLLSISTTNCISLSSYESHFVNNVESYEISLKNINDKLCELKEYFVIDNDYSTFGLPICDLYKYSNQQILEIKSLDKTQIDPPSNLDNDFEKLSHSILIVIQNVYKQYGDVTNSQENALEENHLKEKIHKKLLEDIKMLELKKINQILSDILNSMFTSTDFNHAEMLKRIDSLIQQYNLLIEYFLVHLLSAHKTSTKILSIMLSVFLELAKNGFCVPENLLSDEEQKQEGDTKTGDGFGFEDGEGDKDVSDKLESEDQLDEAKKPEDYNNKDNQEEKDCKEEKGIDMSENFEGKMQDVDENESDSDEPKDDENDEMDKEMGETKEGADKLDDQIWGSDDENEKDEGEEEKNDETGKGSGEKDDKHNDLDAENDQNEQQEGEQDNDGLDAAQAEDDKKSKKQQKKDIDHMDDQGEEDEEQTNPYHNELEEPPEAEDFNLDEEVNLDSGDKEEKEAENEENPLDIDSMKEKIDPNDTDINENEDTKEKEIENDDGGSSGDENDEENSEEKLDDEQNQDQDEEMPNEDSSIPQPDNIDPDEEVNENQENQKELPNDYHESRDKHSKEQNIQSMPNQDNKGSHDQVQVEKMEDETKQQDADIDDQDTGEDKEGVGQAENKESQSGHQGVADTRETRSRKNREKENKQQQRKKGNTDEDRTLGDVNKMEKKFLKTVEKMSREERDENEQEIDDDDKETDEYQHVKDAKSTDKTTLDNATEEQSKKIQHDENKENENDEKESSDNLMDVDEEKQDPEMTDKTSDEMKSKKLDEKSEKPAKKKDESSKDHLEKMEDIEIEGENVVTYNVPRGDETTAHCQMDIVNDSTMCEEQSNAEILEIRKMVEAEITSQKLVYPEIIDMEKWQEVSNRMMSSARELCEQLRLILEPTKCTRLKGDYRTGRRINMKKIIPYIASQFRKDKIWLRRTKAAQRDYKITIAVDDSKSMDHNNSKELTLQTISLVSQALTLLESGKLNVVSFGESTKIIQKYNEQFNGPKLINSLNFDQNKTRIAELLDFTRIMNQEDSSSDNGLFEHLLIILSDGRNIFSEGETKVRNAIKLARLQRMFIVYIIIDNPSNKDSILDIRTVLPFTATEKTMRIVSYMNQFPFPYYVIVRDLNQLPIVLSDGLRQWFELVNSEQ